jgi:hypothetical protein
MAHAGRTAANARCGAWPQNSKHSGKTLEKVAPAEARGGRGHWLTDTKAPGQPSIGAPVHASVRTWPKASTVLGTAISRSSCSRVCRPRNRSSAHPAATYQGALTAQCPPGGLPARQPGCQLEKAGRRLPAQPPACYGAGPPQDTSWLARTKVSPPRNGRRNWPGGTRRRAATVRRGEAHRGEARRGMAGPSRSGEFSGPGR